MITPSSLVSLPSRDAIFSLMTSHSLHAHGETLDQDYDLEAAEHEAKLRFIGARRKIEFRVDDLPFYTFQEDFNLCNQMEVLAESMTQVAIEQFASLNFF